jgi:hypothetical protein
MIRVLTHLRPRSSFLALPSSSFGTSTLPSASWSPPGRLRTFFRDSKEGGPGGSKKFVTSVTTPAKVAFGEESPRYPHLQALPLVSRPIFPGLVTSITLTDEATIDALENLHKNSTSTPAYISCFLRRDGNLCSDSKVDACYPKSFASRRS